MCAEPHRARMSLARCGRADHGLDGPLSLLWRDARKQGQWLAPLLQRLLVGDDPAVHSAARIALDEVETRT